MSRVIIGTAGHIDHGKSSLVRALTGTDPDRLPEEKNRGITIDLGYAFLAGVAAIIDVPGHEKFIRNMVAGAATVDYALLIVAADDGVMPQTTEHLHILRLLGIQAGAIVLTKIDKAEPDWLDLVEDQTRTAVAGTFLENAPLFRVDSLSEKGIPELREFLLRTLKGLPARADRGALRLPIDRVFTIKGRGIVITGSMLSGSVRKDQRLVALPGELDLRVKHLESEGEESDALYAGQRAALNLVGDVERLERGLTLTEPNALISSSRLKVAIDLLPNVPPLIDRQRIRFLVATQEVIGRVQLVEKPDAGRTYAHLLLESDVVTAWGDHFVVRRYSPLETLGGGRVLEPDAAPLRVRNLVGELDAARALDVDSLPNATLGLLQHRGSGGLSANRLKALLGVTQARVKELLASFSKTRAVHEFGDYLLLDEHLQHLAELLTRRLSELHAKQPDSAGFAPSELRQGEIALVPEPLFLQIIERFVMEGRLARDGGVIRMPSKRIELTPVQSDLISKIHAILSGEGFAPSSSSVLSEKLNRNKTEVEKTLVLMEKMGTTRRLGVDLFFDAGEFETAVHKVQSLLASGKEVSVSAVSQELGSSRKYVVPLLEYLDSKGITQRDGNVRVKGRNYSSVTA